jgi:hypothetical protein
MPAVPVSGTYWVDPGRLLAGPHPAWDGTGTAAACIAKLEAAGVGLFVDLTMPGEREPYTPLLRHARHERRGIADRGTATHEAYRGILDLVDAAHRDGERVYVHCLAGIGRTGTVVGCWLRRHGLDDGDALARIAHLRRSVPDAWQRSPETDAQRLVVTQWGDGD